MQAVLVQPHGLTGLLLLRPASITSTHNIDRPSDCDGCDDVHRRLSEATTASSTAHQLPTPPTDARSDWCSLTESCQIVKYLASTPLRSAWPSVSSIPVPAACGCPHPCIPSGPRRAPLRPRSDQVMPPHHRAFTDSLESRQRTAHESTFPSSSTPIGAKGATTSSTLSTAPSAPDPVLAAAAAMTAHEAEAKDEVLLPHTSYPSSRFHSQVTCTSNCSNDDRSAPGLRPSLSVTAATLTSTPTPAHALIADIDTQPTPTSRIVRHEFERALVNSSVHDGKDDGAPWTAAADLSPSTAVLDDTHDRAAVHITPLPPPLSWTAQFESDPNIAGAPASPVIQHDRPRPASAISISIPGDAGPVAPVQTVGPPLASARARRSSPPNWSMSRHPSLDQRARTARSTSHDLLDSRSDRTLRAQSPFPASASASAAELDPEQHWLSEDEARGVYVPTNRRGLTPSQARSRRGEARDRSGGGCTTLVDCDIGQRAAPDSAIVDEHKAPNDLTTSASTIPRGYHSIHHRPSTISQPTNRASPTPSCSTIDPPLTRLLPKLLSLVTCPACQRLFHDPTTLLCGHTVCSECSRPVVHHSVDSSITVASSNVSSSESLFTRNPTIPALGPGISDAPRHPTSAGFEATHGAPMDTGLGGHCRDGLRAVRSTHRGRLRCAQKDCKVSKDQLGTASEARPDFVLQKVLHLLRSDFPLIDRQFEVARIEVAELDETADVEQSFADGYDYLGDASSSERRFDEIAVPERGCISSRSPSGRSISSGGGGEDPTSLDDMKRASRIKPWASFKRARRRHAGSGEMKGRDQPTAISARIELDLDQASSTFLVDLLSELECQICFQLLHDPITSQCGHTFCQKCLVRSYDHSDKCPLCRHDFPSSVRFRSQPINFTTQRIILSLFPSLAEDRFAQIPAEERGADEGFDTPLFVCTLAWPNLPTYIHIFEPRYRLMIRRAMEGTREFGMVLPSRDLGGINEYGTMLKIQSCNMIEDGRSIIETVGTYRFRILEKGVLDGYTVVRIERVYDIPQDQEAQLERQALARNVQSAATSLVMAGTRQIERSTSELMEICLDFVSTLRNGSAPWVLQRLNNTIGPMPTTPADFSFWMAEVMPVDDQSKALLLQITSPRERLRLLVFWIEQFRSSWWFSRGCKFFTSDVFRAPKN
ncbi:BQ2448_6246 [Microbotryum intermedium]|uniref:BQ2448_6246 protein n=1 Tax=Microbotryum intermedium TaxID=269621 RepID=A0A238FRT2_9BASI|nr:BQ2448_6246 [Microbotryum intermedium]